jgi:hypothetical protein
MALSAGAIYFVSATQDGEQTQTVVETVTPDAANTGTSVGSASPSPLESLTPQVTPTSTATPVEGFPTDFMFIGGTVWVDAEPVITNVSAVIDGIECATTTTSLLGESAVSGFYFSVPSDQVRAGCGVPGAVIEFIVDGATAPVTVQWQPASHPPIDLIIGAPFARYFGTFTYTGDVQSFVVAALIGTSLCGSYAGPQQGTGGPGSYTYFILVESQESEPGCGHDGADVVFHLSVTTPLGLVEAPVVLPTAPWQPGPIVTLPHSGDPLQKATAAVSE